MSLKAAVVWVSLAFEWSCAFSFYTGVENDSGQWDLGQAPEIKATGHLVFATANNLIQHWANTRYRIGHTIVPGTIPVGTLLYHGSITGPHLPIVLDWVSVEPDHSMIFCHGSIETGCWHLTLEVTRPMKVLYFDGSSAVRIPEGTMDTKILWHGRK
ncbi:hypothetical protein BDR07DRAFT_1372019 [Suillus spraguei]|nr:hypothetical protein BDR07DRAFT_1372019 [Suillus spraguei]